MGIFLKVVQFLAKYGPRAVSWAWANKKTILDWVGRGLTFDWIYNQIKKLLGLR
jgi:hypothetical protein